jgi:hypothetical protein
VSRVRGRLVDNHEFAFKLPAGFRRQTGRHATSWESFHHVDPSRDLALQLFASAPLTPAHRSGIDTHRQHIRAQFVAWSCSSDRVDELQERLATVDLRFAYVEELSDEQVRRGAICDPMFEPTVGLFPMALDWERFDRGSVRTTLEQAGLLRELPAAKVLTLSPTRLWRCIPLRRRQQRNLKRLPKGTRRPDFLWISTAVWFKSSDFITCQELMTNARCHA